MNLKILSKEDVSIILGLYQTDFSDGWNKEQLISSFDSGYFLCIGAFLEDELVGVITATKSFEDADIEGIVTKNQFRNRGIASTLMNRLIEELSKSKVKNIFLEVRESNSVAIALYKKFNFKLISQRKKYYSNGENALIFKREE